ncbi:unnamed protein product [Effrenium voratum]|uniref:ABC transporter domain-containing protein n=1 Tax=Effrenium voratum TaxID=2562239 RepID=A0AA36HXG0_9DINO|nr:unnamed protein product [Effrenium voratum]
MSWSTSVLVGVLWITTSALFSTYANGQFLRRPLGKFERSKFSVIGAAVGASNACAFTKEWHKPFFAMEGYSRRAQMGDGKSNDRRRLLTDRNAYIAYLEGHVERFNSALLEVEAAATELRLLHARVDDLEERLQSSHQTIEAVQAQRVQHNEVSQTDRQDTLEQIHRLEARNLRLEQAMAEGRSVAEADMARMRNELSLAVQELGQRIDERLRLVKDRFDERMQSFQDLSNDEAALVIREAQATCVRLADDALGAAEESQKKVEEVAQRTSSAQRRLEDVVQQTEAGLEALRAELVAIRAEIAGHAVGGELDKDPNSQDLADVVERRLAARLGQQVLQLSEVLQRVVSAQAALSQQLGGRNFPASQRFTEDAGVHCQRQPGKTSLGIFCLGLMVPSVLLLVANLLNSMSMLCSGVTLTYVVKSLIPFFTVISCRLRGQRFETSIYLSLVPVCLGVSLASATDVECSLEGILCALGSSLAQTWLNITSKEKIQTLKLSGMEAFTVMATVCAGLSIPLLAVSYAKDKGDGIVTACLSLSQKPCYTSFKVIAMAAFAYHVEYTLNFLFVALCNPLAFSVTDIVRRLGTICCGAVLFNKPMTLTNGSGVAGFPGKQVLHAMQARRQLSFPVPYCTLKWEDLEVAYRTHHGRRVTLHRQSGSVEGSCMMAIMGASGAGKSTLLDTLTKRKTLGDVSGKVYVNGRPQDEHFFFASAYVPQEENLVPTNTVGETVEFYADLTMPRQISSHMRRRAVSERLQSVGLADKEGKFVGGRLPGGFSIRGLSGGERRRLNIAAGVVHSPPLVFLDEPTTGLDAFSALCVMESIRALARAGHVVACTIHQPRQAIVDMFDKVLFLACGHLVYNGPPSGLRDWLTESGLWDPDRALTTSITDMVLDCITVGFEKPPHIYGIHTLRDESDVERLAAAYLKSAPQLDFENGTLPSVSRMVHRRPGFLRQYRTLQWQQLRSSLRSPGTLAARIGLHFLTGVLMGSVYYDMERSYIEPPTGLWRALPLPLQRHSSMPENRVGVLFLLALAQTVTPNCAMPFFIDDRQYYSKESAARLYGALPYHLANAASEAVVCMVNGIWASGIATYLAGLPLSGNWFSTMAFLVSHHMCSSALVQMCARLAPNQDVAFVLSAGYIIVCMLFANIVVKVAMVTPFLAWIRWCTFMYFSMAGLIEAEFSGTTEQGFPAGDKVVESFRIRFHYGEEEIHSLDQMSCLLIVWCFYAFFSTVGFVALKFGSKSQV